MTDGRSDRLFVLGGWTAGIGGFAIPVVIVAYLAWHGVAAIDATFLSAAPTGGALDGGGGIGPAIKGSLALVGIGLAAALPLAIGGGIYLAECNRSPAADRVARLAIETLAAIPGLVYSLFGYAFLVVGLQFKISLLAGGLTLGLVMLPLILIGTHEALRAVDPALRESAQSLGVSRVYQLRRVVLPLAMPAILTSVALAAAHAFGAAAPLLYTAATVMAPGPLGLDQPVMALPTHLYFVTSERGATIAAFGTALVLVVVVLAVTAAATALKHRHHV